MDTVKVEVIEENTGIFLGEIFVPEQTKLQIGKKLPKSGLKIPKNHEITKINKQHTKEKDGNFSYKVIVYID